MLTQIINARILTPQGWLKDGSVLIRDNKILEVTNCDLAIVGATLIDAKECTLCLVELKSMYMAGEDEISWKDARMLFGPQSKLTCSMVPQVSSRHFPLLLFQ